ncbi:MAG: BrnT family toxin [Beijerinckiaceae bacterium]|nr:BrnT family toxin [Beijerinckiaceae bacterium]
MEIEFDPAKEATNLAKHRISLGRAKELEVLAFQEDRRFDYGETRYRAWGMIDGAIYSLAFTRVEGRLRAISLRRAQDKEMRRHVPRT